MAEKHHWVRAKTILKVETGCDNGLPFQVKALHSILGSPAKSRDGLEKHSFQLFRRWGGRHVRRLEQTNGYCFKNKDRLQSQGSVQECNE